jgi:hypothetical protein
VKIVFVKKQFTFRGIGDKIKKEIKERRLKY